MDNENKRQDREQKRNRLIIIALLCVIIVLLIIILLRGCDTKKPTGETEKPTNNMEVEDAEDYTGDRETYHGEKNTDTIDIPGFDVMNLKAGETTQAVNLYNPIQNTCYFKMSLMLSDRTVLWQSKLVEPGKGIYEIELNRALEAGVYEGAILKYECFSLEDQSPLNGSEITLALNVLK